jgi:hypothetical protein
VVLAVVVVVVAVVVVRSYVFVGVGFPMHRDLIWSIVRPL